MDDSKSAAQGKQALSQPSLFDNPKRGPATLADLQKANAADEGSFDGYLGRKIIYGVDTSFGYLRLVHQNRPSRANDRAIYETDFRFELDGRLCGFLDIEVKRRWRSGPWPFWKINIAKHPLSHWIRRCFGSRETNKLLDFKRFPHTSMWVGLRSDYKAAVVVLASDIFTYGVDTYQKTSYLDAHMRPADPLPIKELPLRYGRAVYSPEEMCQVVIDIFEAAYALG